MQHQSHVRQGVRRKTVPIAAKEWKGKRKNRPFLFIQPNTAPAKPRRRGLGPWQSSKVPAHSVRKIRSSRPSATFYEKFPRILSLPQSNRWTSSSLTPKEKEMTACDFAPVRPGPSGSHQPSRGGLPRGAYPQPARPPPADALIGQGRPEPLRRRGDLAKLGGHPAIGRSHAGSSQSSGSCTLAPRRERGHHPAPGLCNYMWSLVSSRRRNPPPYVG